MDFKLIPRQKQPMLSFLVLIMGNSTNQDAQPYKYVNKVPDRFHGLDWYDFSARSYDAAVGRFLSVDPMAEKYYDISPYAYCHNNPTCRIDPTGMTDYYNLKGKKVYSEGEEHDNVLLFTKSNK